MKTETYNCAECGDTAYKYAKAICDRCNATLCHSCCYKAYKAKELGVK